MVSELTSRKRDELQQDTWFCFVSLNLHESWENTSKDSSAGAFYIDVGKFAALLSTNRDIELRANELMQGSWAVWQRTSMARRTESDCRKARKRPEWIGSILKL
jgi:hypothetical protein